MIKLINNIDITTIVIIVLKYQIFQRYIEMIQQYKEKYLTYVLVVNMTEIRGENNDFKRMRKKLLPRL